MKTLRTPDRCFDQLEDFPFAPHYAEISDQDGGTLRVHYLDEGPATASPILLLHGEPTWSYLYRTVIPPLVAAGHRVIVPDQVGFGRSDKPEQQSDYTYARHVSWMSELIFEVLNLQDITFFGQDWGGLIGLRLVAAQPERFARVAIGNTGLPTGDHSASEAFLKWQQFSQTTEHFPVGKICTGACVNGLSPSAIAAYDAPFPEDRYKAGARIWPSLVCTSPQDVESSANRQAWESLKKFQKPFLCCFSDQDPVTQGGDKIFKKLIPGAQGQPHVTIEGGGHFLQEDCGPELAGVLISFINA
ncbi:MAG: haloalkane dehalogenase [Acidimicrobiales bacterium]|nr:haloalkane dehalogenase [Acidimicrobiales bacterium]